MNSTIVIEYRTRKEYCIIREYVYETISFFATSSYDRIIIEDSEFEKVKQFILNEIISI